MGKDQQLVYLVAPRTQNDGTLYPPMTPLSTFRGIFNTYFSAGLHLLENHSYLRIWHQPAQKRKQPAEKKDTQLEFPEPKAFQALDHPLPIYTDGRGDSNDRIPE